MQDKDLAKIKESLKELGLTNTQSMIYLTLLKKESANSTPLRSHERMPKMSVGAVLMFSVMVPLSN